MADGLPLDAVPEEPLLRNQSSGLLDRKLARETSDRLALLLKNKIILRSNRRVVHVYVESFYGRQACKLLTSTGAVPSNEKALECLAELLKRGIIERVDQTRPMFNNVVRIFNPALAASREDRKRRRHNEKTRISAQYSHLYRFEMSAFCKHVLSVRVVCGRDLARPTDFGSTSKLKRSMRSLRGSSFIRTPSSRNSSLKSASFKDASAPPPVDPMVRLKFGSRQQNTTSVHCDTSDPEFDEKFTFLVEEGAYVNDLWLTAYDFGEVTRNVSLGSVCVTWEQIWERTKHGKEVFTKEYQLTSNEVSAQAHGEISLEIEIRPFKHYSRDKTVFKESRPERDENEDILRRRKLELNASKKELVTRISNEEDLNAELSPISSSDVPTSKSSKSFTRSRRRSSIFGMSLADPMSAHDPRKTVSYGHNRLLMSSGSSLNLTQSLNKATLAEHYKLRVENVRIRHAYDLRADCQLWIEAVYRKGEESRATRREQGYKRDPRTATQPVLWTRASQSEDGTFDLPVGLSLKPLTRDQVEEPNAFIEFRLWRKYDLIRSNLGSAKFFLRKIVIVEDDENEWKSRRRTVLTVLRKPTFKKSANRKIAELGVNCVLEPWVKYLEDDDTDDEDLYTPSSSRALLNDPQDFLARPGEIELEDALAGLKSAEGESDLPWIEHQLFDNELLPKTVVDVSAERAGAVILSHNSDFFHRLAHQMSYEDMTISEWVLAADDASTVASTSSTEASSSIEAGNCSAGPNLSRKIEYTMKNNMVGMVRVFQVQKLVSLAPEGFKYETRTQVPKVPFGTRFFTVNRVSVKRLGDGRRCEFHCTGTVEWVEGKKPNWMLEGRIRSTAINGMGATFKVFLKVLDLYLAKQTRRNSRENLFIPDSDVEDDEEDLDRLEKIAKKYEQTTGVDKTLEVADQVLHENLRWLLLLAAVLAAVLGTALAVWVDE